MKMDFVLRERMGEQGVRALADYVEDRGQTWRADVLNECFDRFDTTLQKRLTEMEVRLDARLSERIAATKVEFLDRVGDMRVELVRWTFGFWVGQAVVISGALAVLFQLLGR